MSIKTTNFRNKRSAFLRKNPSGDISVMFPQRDVRGTGRTQIYVSQDGVDTEGKPVRAGKRIPGRANLSVHTRRMRDAKITSLSKVK